MRTTLVRSNAPSPAARTNNENAHGHGRSVSSGLASLANAVNSSPGVAAQRKALDAAFGPLQRAGKKEEKLQKKADGSGHGLPQQLRTGVETLAGVSMEGVRVHYNSPQPAQLNAHAYAQGSDIHLAPGQEKHLPHEAWHVAQQSQGRVRATAQLKEGVSINDDAGLESEADRMGARAMQMKTDKDKKR
jgi:hypothetical protein